MSISTLRLTGPRGGKAVPLVFGGPLSWPMLAEKGELASLVWLLRGGLAGVRVWGFDRTTGCALGGFCDRRA
jgi:hypothetical protein